MGTRAIRSLKQFATDKCTPDNPSMDIVSFKTGFYNSFEANEHRKRNHRGWERSG